MVKFKGFTLIELMIVVAILAILASVIVGPAKKNKAINTETDNAKSDKTIIVINGKAHECDDMGVCDPIE